MIHHLFTKRTWYMVSVWHIHFRTIGYLFLVYLKDAGLFSWIIKLNSINWRFWQTSEGFVESVEEKKKAFNFLSVQGSSAPPPCPMKVTNGKKSWVRSARAGKHNKCVRISVALGEGQKNPRCPLAVSNLCTFHRRLNLCRCESAQTAQTSQHRSKAKEHPGARQD